MTASVLCQCTCLSECTNPATQEDFLCDPCREFERANPDVHLAHAAPADAPGPHTVFEFAGPVSFTLDLSD